MSIGEDIRALGWAFTQAGVATVTGAIIDNAFVSVDTLSSLSPVQRVLLQFGGGVLVLGAAMRAVSPANQISPVGDGIMIYFFYDAQPGMRAALAALRTTDLMSTATMKPSAAPITRSTFENVDTW